ncbi:hypothetical protein [Sorangium sp. So ce426]|uniref:hypothetical protein n=1 Tax=Sorangium sp. So ce426 TaxID=3133312 RepID=UPI003F5C17E6
MLIEIKMAGDHVGIGEIKRATLRRLAREIERIEEREPPWMGEEPLWVVAPHLPSWLHSVRTLGRFAPGCYRVGPSPFQFLWLAANELPLRDELVPFLVARSGRALDELARWVAPRRDVEWVISILEYLPMSQYTREDLLRRFARSDDPEIDPAGVQGARPRRGTHTRRMQTPPWRSHALHAGHRSSFWRRPSEVSRTAIVRPAGYSVLAHRTPT